MCNKKKKRGLYVAILILLLLLLTGCGKDSKYIGRYKMYHTGWASRYLEINEDSTASLYDMYDTLTGPWKEKKDGSIELKLTQIGTEIFNAKFVDEDNTDVIGISGGYFGNQINYFIREDSDTHDMLSNYNVQEVLDALSEGVSINEINTYINNNNTSIAKSEQDVSQTVLVENETNSETTVNTTENTTQNTTENTTISINNYKNPEIKINGKSFDELLKEAQKQSEDVMISQTASWAEGAVINKMNYLGYYALSAKDKKAKDSFGIILVYKLDVSNDVDGDLSYYWYCLFDKIVSLGGNEYSMDLSDYTTTKHKFNSPSGTYWYYGYESLDSLFHNTIAENIASFDYVSEVQDIASKDEVDDTSTENEEVIE